jgi:predicted enzyme related to lactoylglutathione lyase
VVVKRIVLDVATETVAEVQKFYSDLFGLAPIMDQGWIVTLASEHSAQVQVSIASEGGSGTPVPDASIEVDDVDAAYERAKSMGCKIEYTLTDEPWGVRRFFLLDPAGKLLNILAHKQ